MVKALARNETVLREFTVTRLFSEETVHFARRWLLLLKSGSDQNLLSQHVSNVLAVLLVSLRSILLRKAVLKESSSKVMSMLRSCQEYPPFYYKNNRRIFISTRIAPTAPSISRSSHTYNRAQNYPLRE
jgi:hypothetical protein